MLSLKVRHNKHMVDDFARMLIETHPLDTARVLERYEPEQAWEQLELMDEVYRAPIIEGFSPAFAARVLLVAGATELIRMIRALPSEISVDILEYVPDDVRDELLAALPHLHAEEIASLSEYPDHTAGSIMTPDFVALREDATVADALTRLRRLALVGRNVNYVYVVNDDEQLAGVLMMRDLILSNPSASLKSIMIADVLKVYTLDELEDVKTMLLERRLLAVPVVNDGEQLVGVVLATQLVNELQEEGFEDAQKMFGAGSDERASSSPFFAIQKRMPWLQVNLITAFMAAAVVGAFENVIAQVTILAAFLPVVAGQGGNAGAQALAVMLRSIALEEIDVSKPRKVLIKEALVGLINGLGTGLVAAIIAVIVSQNIALGVVIFIAMTINLIVAGVAGATIPILMERWGQDPAQSSNIILTTVTDIIGFASFLGLAVLAMPWLT